MDFDFRQLESFCLIVARGSFSRAAETLCIAQATVSERIANLEAIVGVRLLDRLGRSVVPTEAGRQFYGHARALLDSKQRTQMEMEAFLGHLRGTVRIGASTIPGDYILPELIGRFRQQYPDITIEVVIGDSGQIARQVIAGEVELGIVGSRPSEQMLESLSLWKDELVLVVSADHPWSGRKRLSIDELIAEPLVLREYGSGTQQTFLKELEPDLLETSGTLTIACILGSSGAVKEAVKAGVGVAFISSRAIQAEVTSGSLRTVRVEGISIHRHFHLTTDKRRSRSPLCEAVVEYLTNDGKS